MINYGLRLWKNKTKQTKKKTTTAHSHIMPIEIGNVNDKTIFWKSSFSSCKYGRNSNSYAFKISTLIFSITMQFKPNQGFDVDRIRDTKCFNSITLTPQQSMKRSHFAVTMKATFFPIKKMTKVVQTYLMCRCCCTQETNIMKYFA